MSTTIIILLLLAALVVNLGGFAFLYVASQNSYKYDDSGRMRTQKDLEYERKIKEKENQLKEKTKVKEEELAEPIFKATKMKDLFNFGKKETEEELIIKKPSRFEEPVAEEIIEKEEDENKKYFEEQRLRMIEAEERESKEKEKLKYLMKEDKLYERFDMDAKYDEKRVFKEPIDEEDEIIIRKKETEEDPLAYRFDSSKMNVEREIDEEKERKSSDEIFKKEPEIDYTTEDYSKYFEDYASVPLERVDGTIEKEAEITLDKLIEEAPTFTNSGVKRESAEEKAQKEVFNLLENITEIKRNDNEIAGYKKQTTLSEEERRALEYGEKTIFDIKEQKLKEEKEEQLKENKPKIQQPVSKEEGRSRRTLMETANVEEERPETIFDIKEKEKEEKINIKQLEPSKYEGEETGIQKKNEVEDESKIDSRIEYLMKKMKEEK